VLYQQFERIPRSLAVSMVLSDFVPVATGGDVERERTVAGPLLYFNVSFRFRL
jgi:hypothetical protein